MRLQWPSKTEFTVLSFAIAKKLAKEKLSAHVWKTQKTPTHWDFPGHLFLK